MKLYLIGLTILGVGGYYFFSGLVTGMPTLKIVVDGIFHNFLGV